MVYGPSGLDPFEAEVRHERVSSVRSRPPSEDYWHLMQLFSGEEATPRQPHTTRQTEAATDQDPLDSRLHSNE